LIQINALTGGIGRNSYTLTRPRSAGRRIWSRRVQMRTLKPAVMALGGLLTASVVYGASAALAVNAASPVIGSDSLSWQ
jgi:hypothetical protein